MLEKELFFADLPISLSEIYETMGYADAVPDNCVVRNPSLSLPRLPELVLKSSSIRCNKRGIW